MKIVFVISSRQGEFCGVYNYTQKLQSALIEQGADTSIETFPDWSFPAAWTVFKKYRAQRDAILHLQYPSHGMGKSIAPALLPLFLGFRRTMVTLHEFSIFNRLRKAIFLPYKFAARIIFTNAYEHNEFLKCFKAANNISVIPIGNNISAPSCLKPLDKRAARLIYFGQIAPGKGLEDFLDTARMLRDRGHTFPITIAGSIPDPGTEIAERIIRETELYNIELLLELPETEVSQLLSICTIALLMFADGISEKRGSAIACLEHDVQVITRHSEKTPQWLRDITYAASSPGEAADMVERLLKAPSIIDTSANEGLRKMKWLEIARSHIRLYRQIAQQRR